MSESTKPESKADELTKTTDKANIELNEEELGSVRIGLRIQDFSRPDCGSHSTLKICRFLTSDRVPHSGLFVS